MIEITDVTKKFGSFKALDGVSLHIGRAESVCLLGENGAGKSTLIKCILGMLEYSGQIKLNNKLLYPGSTDHKFDIGYIPQQPVFYDMKVDEVMSFFAVLRKADSAKINKSIEFTGLSDHTNKLTSELSGGLKQRLSFAVALLTDPPVLILDEPTSNLDASARLDLLKIVKTLNECGKTVLFSSHRMDEVEYLAERVYVLKAAKIVKESTQKQLADNLGLKTKIVLNIKPDLLSSTEKLLSAKGLTSISRNGAGLYVNIEKGEKLTALKIILENNIAADDISIETPSMDEIIRSL
ncbi:MAG: ABC transporter ATP-binding protein [Candidatus Dadabacteria bacterium]|nr:ABC transporter ATP-binding protein [Candidatus Dadabacteria bacterium]NIS07335.1 ABC transporter ATP-binding protein [Candidatus Dadabacteria bacterium]NIV41279.1 ATP-binding cassette domain-containing protein [Candidatus Dadabacteria bacterium]NIX14514.1 ATP-binding cassette domain-containing protein [Candidatus Dadabacteria bacterium]NIY20972.1 ATP-binding cassette domain-containing protein [Candidatus Dadabacteria bacterium]